MIFSGAVVAPLFCYADAAPRRDPAALVPHAGAKPCPRPKGAGARSPAATVLRPPAPVAQGDGLRPQPNA